MYVQGFSNNQNIILKLKSIKRFWCISDMSLSLSVCCQNLNAEQKRFSCHSKKRVYYNIRFIDLMFSDCLKFNDVVDG